MKLDDSVGSVPFVGKTYVRKLKKLDISTVRDLVYHFPHRYQDYSLVTDITKTQPGETVTIHGQIVAIKNIYTLTGKKIQKAVVSDGENNIDVTWFNQTYLVRSLPVGTQVSLSGKVQLYGRKKVLVSPHYERLQSTDYGLQKNNSTIHTGRLVPIYPETYGVSSKWLRSRIDSVLPKVGEQIDDFLPDEIKEKFNLANLQEAIQHVHFPEDLENAERARRRLGYDEFFEMQLASLLRRSRWKEKKLSHQLKWEKEELALFVKSLPFQLTSGQKSAMRDILKDLKGRNPMNRLLEGDVGAGKTVVAAIAMYVAFLNGFQSAIMAPTQILAMQHCKTLQDILGPLGVGVELITGDKRKVKRDNDRKNTSVFVGTHALIQNKVDFDKLALIVIDEQHRFGVAQRALLARKGKGKTPHILTMTATPIPRTVALTAYGDLSLSLINELPQGRRIIKTWVVLPKKREAAYEWIRTRIKDTREQAFVVCPIIEESQAETMQSVRAATQEFERLKEKVFPDLKLGLLHGKVKAQEKDKIMNDMREGKLDILVATPVVEVGVDIPAATIMVVEAAERFGLAQLHQLRGRVGRASLQSYCLLFPEIRSPKVMHRLYAMEQNLSGAELAELDLKLRGPGNVLGTAQHGFPEMKVASFSDTKLLRQAREGAEIVLKNLPKYPKIAKFLRAREKEIAPN